jgi:AcrR family transcriptional regulator
MAPPELYGGDLRFSKRVSELISTQGLDEEVGAVTTVQGERPLRADAQRNREKLLTAAMAAFAERGVDASLEDIARTAGVGIGTLYRHFPSRDALMEAVYRHQVETLCDAASDLLATHTPDEALALWMERFVAHVATKRGMAMALKSVIGKDSELFAYCHGLIRQSAASLLKAAADAGAIRDDVDANDLMKAMSGICLVSDQPGWEEQASRLVNLLVDGLRFRAPVQTT